MEPRFTITPQNEGKTVPVEISRSAPLLPPDSGIAVVPAGVRCVRGRREGPRHANVGRSHASSSFAIAPSVLACPKDGQMLMMITIS